jgi:hypothetical protein
MKCKHCGKPIVQDNVVLKWWQHTDGYYNCDGFRGHAKTYAEPKTGESESCTKIENNVP